MIGYKGLMTGYQNQVIRLAGDKQKGEVQLVINLFQSVLDGFIRGEIKKAEAEPAKVKYHKNGLTLICCHSLVSPYLKRSCIHGCFLSQFQPPKARKKRRKKDKSVSIIYSILYLEFNLIFSPQ